MPGLKKRIAEFGDWFFMEWMDQNWFNWIIGFVLAMTVIIVGGTLILGLVLLTYGLILVPVFLYGLWKIYKDWCTR